jgi:hypothetical protein
VSRPRQGNVLIQVWFIPESLSKKIDVEDTATDRFRSLEADRLPIPAIHQRDDDWYVTAAHLQTVITELLADGLSVTVTPVIEACDLAADVRPADAPPLPLRTD